MHAVRAATPGKSVHALLRWIQAPGWPDRICFGFMEWLLRSCNAATLDMHPAYRSMIVQHRPTLS